MKYLLLSSLLAVCLLTACQDNVLFNAEKPISNGQWSYRDTVDFKFTVSDTAARYKMSLLFQHSDTFPNQNIYLRLHTLFPDGKRITSVRSFDLFDAQGNALGKKSGHLYENASILQEVTHFNAPGEYVLTLEQFGRKDPMQGIASVGLVVEQYKKEGK